MKTANKTRARNKSRAKSVADHRSRQTRRGRDGQSQASGHAKPGTNGNGEFFHVVVRPKAEFSSFRTQDVGKPGGIERVAGQRANGSWSTQKWLISKTMAHVEDGELFA